MHSCTTLPTPSIVPLTFLATLATFGNSSLWDNLSVDGDGEWICAGIEMGTLYIMHNRSYMAEEATNLCSTGVVIFCQRSRQWLKVSVAECSDAANNYRRELLGAVISLLILRAASVEIVPPIPTTILYCDNRGVISHSNSPLTALPKKQKQADLIRLINFLSSSNTCSSSWEWVEGHAVECKGWRNCTLPKRLNNQAEKLAKDALISAISGSSTIEGALPFEVVKFSLSGNQVHGSPHQALEVDWRYRTAQALYDTKNIIRSEDFHLVWWDGLSTAMSCYPKMYCVWLTKHVSDFCRNNVQLYYWSKGTHSPKCECYGIMDKYTMHICRCLDLGCNEMFWILVGELTSWLIETLGKHSIALTVEMYLLARGEAKISSRVHDANVGLVILSVQTDRLGWDSFLEGRLSSPG